MNSPSGTKPGDVLVKKPRVSETPPTEFVVSERRIRARTLSSPMLLIIIFIDITKYTHIFYNIVFPML